MFNCRRSPQPRYITRAIDITVLLHNCVLTISGNSLYALCSQNVDTKLLYCLLNLYLIILWTLDFKYILLLIITTSPPSRSETIS